MISAFKFLKTKFLAEGLRVKRFVNIGALARRELMQLQISSCLEDLRVPPGNRLEKLKGDREGYYSIRINDQFRLCFYWDLGRKM